MYYKAGSGKTYLKFTKIESGIGLYIMAGSDFTNSSQTLVTNNGSVTLDMTYEIDISVNYVIVAVPELNNWNTSFSFEYYTDGEKYSMF